MDFLFIEFQVEMAADREGRVSPCPTSKAFGRTWWVTPQSTASDLFIILELESDCLDCLIDTMAI